MSENGGEQERTLNALLDRIDTIDAEMHRLLVERGSVIGSLIDLVYEDAGSSETGVFAHIVYVPRE